MNLLETHIDLDAIAHNMELVRDRAGQAQCMAIVKADAYNHGFEHVAPVLAAHGAAGFGVATIAEALALRAVVSEPITCWLWSPQQDFQAALAADIQLAVPSIAHAQAIRQAAASQAAPVRVCVKVDTGMHRSGVALQQLEQTLAILQAPNIVVTGLMSHLAAADVLGAEEATYQQIAAFEQAIACGRAAGFALLCNHLANSAGVVRFPEAHHEMVRPGVALYGLEPVPSQPIGLRPAMSWVARVLVVKDIEAGDGVSYGFTWRAPRAGRVAVVSVGYADGLWRQVQDHLRVTIRGRQYPQIGRVCMDQIIIDLGDDPDGVASDDAATVFGAGGMSATELADAVGTIHYEVVCSPRGRTVRSYTGYPASTSNETGTVVGN